MNAAWHSADYSL